MNESERRSARNRTADHSKPFIKVATGVIFERLDGLDVIGRWMDVADLQRFIDCENDVGVREALSGIVPRPFAVRPLPVVLKLHEQD